MEHLIWILDNDKESQRLCREAMGKEIQACWLESVEELFEKLTDQQTPRPHLLIADPERTQGSFAASLSHLRGSTHSVFFIPDFIIVSKLDDINVMRFYLRCGARDYLLKPIRRNEFGAKLENILESLIPKDAGSDVQTVDDIQVSDLTLRERQLLNVFLGSLNRSVNRGDLHGSVWSKVVVNPKTLDVHIYNLRRKLRTQGYDIFYKDMYFTLRKIPGDLI